MDSYLGQIVYTVARVNASEKLTPAEREQVINRQAEELQAEVDKFKYDTAADMDYVNAIRERVGRELVWLDVHKDPDVFSRETVLSPSNDPVSQLWNHVTGQFRGWERAPQPPKHFQGMLLSFPSMTAASPTTALWSILYICLFRRPVVEYRRMGVESGSGKMKTLSLKELSLQYVTNEIGEKTAVILPIGEFEELVEDIEDLAVVAERREEPTIAHDVLVSQLKEGC